MTDFSSHVGIYFHTGGGKEVWEGIEGFVDVIGISRQEVGSVLFLIGHTQKGGEEHLKMYANKNVLKDLDKKIVL